MSDKTEYQTFTLANGKVLELGPLLRDGREMSFHDIDRNLLEFNDSLPQEESPWRVPSREEYKEIGEPITKIWRDTSKNRGGKEIAIREYLRNLGFNGNIIYWSCSENNEYSQFASCFYGGGDVCEQEKHHQFFVRLVRERTP